MFACLRVEEEAPRGIVGRIFQSRRVPVTQRHMERAYGAEYLTVTARVTRRRGLDWEEIYSLTRPRVDCLLLPEGVEAPRGLPLRKPRFSGFEQQVLINTACELIRRTGLPMYRRVLGMLDEDGSCADALEKLLRYFTLVRVVTGNPSRYEQAAQRMLELFGAPVIVGDAVGEFADCVLILSPHDLPAESRGARFSCPVLAGGAFERFGRGDVFSGLEVMLPDDESSDIPPGISAHEFAGALYRYHGVEVSGLIAERLLYNNKRARLSEAVYAVLRSAGFPAGL